MPAAEISIQTLTPERWCDLVDLFGPERGANSGCWCMWPFLRGKDWKALTREERRDAFRNKAMNGPAPGLLAYRGGQAVGWVALGPRENYARFQLSKVTRPLETDSRELIRSTFAVTCFYVRSGHRKAGLMPLLLAAAVDHAGQQGAKVVDACPIDADKPSQWGEGFVGFTPVFRRGGFEEIARRSPRRPLMRRYL
ncbi:GNAT family N-acetyltransferase [Roseibium sp.]|uniref:GNAT family N-acetyltransferase n=1 Tax=Roseibium sp. TaxID=1936156 RepID=UPI003D113AB7